MAFKSGGGDWNIDARLFSQTSTVGGVPVKMDILPQKNRNYPKIRLYLYKSQEYQWMGHTLKDASFSMLNIQWSNDQNKLITTQRLYEVAFTLNSPYSIMMAQSQDSNIKISPKNVGVIGRLPSKASFTATVQHMTGISKVPKVKDKAYIGSITLSAFGVQFGTKDQGDWGIPSGQVAFCIHKPSAILKTHFDRAMSRLCDKDMVCKINNKCEIKYKGTNDPPMIIFRRPLVQ